MGRKIKKELEEYLIKIRRKEVTDMWFSGSTIKEMAAHFKVDERTIYRDCEYIENHADELMKNYLVKTVPFIINKSLYQIDQANKIVSKIARDPEADRKERIAAALASAKTARDVVEIVAGNKGVIEKALELDQSLKGEQIDELLLRNSTETKEPDQDPNKVF